MIKGVCQKVESLSDGSIKLSVYVNKEDIAKAFPLAFQTVMIGLEEELNQGNIDRAEFYRDIKNTLLKLTDLITNDKEMVS